MNNFYESLCISEAEIYAIIEKTLKYGISSHELQKVKNQAYTSLAFQEVELLNRAMNLAFFTSIGDPGLINEEQEKIRAVTQESVMNAAEQIFSIKNMNILHYQRINS